MDQVSKIRLRNVIDNLLVECENPKDGGEKVVLLRVCIVTINQLRMHANLDTMLGCDVRELNKRVEKCKTIAEYLALWDEALDLLIAYKEELLT